MSKDFMNNKKENRVKREYSDQEIKKILSEDIETPEYVNQRIKDTYECLGIHHNKKSPFTHYTFLNIFTIPFKVNPTIMISAPHRKPIGTEDIAKWL